MSNIISTEAFLDAVLPAGNHYIGYTDGTLNKSGRPVIKCSSFQSGQHGVTVAKRKGDTDVYFALASFKEEKIYDAKNGYMKSFRHQDNVDKLKSLWLDVDIKSYESREACARDIQRFLTDFPNPTFIVDSGGGFHLYWCFEKELTPTQWQPLAQGLAAIAKTKKLRADYGVTIDSARVLRLPGSKNQKYDHKPECEVKVMGAYASLDRMDELLRPHAASALRTGIEVDSNVVAMFDPVTANEDLGGNYSAGKKSLFASIIPECAVVADSMARGGQGDEYALWKDLLHLAAFTDDGAGFAHEISKGDERYDPETVEDFYGQSVEIRAAGTRGPTTCSRFSMHSDKCSVCPHAGKIKTPWVLGVPIEEKFTRTPSFVMNGNTMITKMVEDEDGNMVMEEDVLLHGVALDNWRIVPTVDEEKPFELWLEAANGKSKRTIKLDGTDIADGKRFKVEMFNGGVGLDTVQAGKVTKVANAWVTHLQKLQDGVHYTSTGWQNGEKAFVLGDRAITADGVETVVNTALGASVEKLRPHGEPEPWLKMAQKLLDDEEPAFTYLLCAGMSAPLMGILSHKCSLAVSAFSTHSGAGKTTVLRTVRAAFSDPNSGMGLSDTATSIVIKMGGEQGLPAIYDEIRGNDAGDKIVDILFQISEGKTKLRANQNAEVRKQYKLNTIMLCGSNIPISDYVNQRIKGSNAGLARFLEIELQPKKTADIETDTLLATLGENYGHFGPEFIRTTITNMKDLKRIEAQVFEALQKKRTWSPEERFWLQGTAKILIAGLIMNLTKQVKVDMKKLMDFALSAVEAQKSEIADRISNDDNILAQLIDKYAEEFLVTKKFKRGQGRGTVQIERHPMRQKVVLHASVEDRALRVSKATIREMAHEMNVPNKTLVDQLKHRFKAKELRVALGAGAGAYSGANQPLLELDLDAMEDGEALIASWLPETDTASTSSQPAKPDS